MLIAVANLDIPPDPSDNKPSNGISDILGFGKVCESFANSFGKVVEKIPSQKLTPGMALEVIILIISLIFIGFILYNELESAVLISICVLVFDVIAIGPFIFLEIYKEVIKNKEK